MSIGTNASSSTIHLRPDDYHLIGPEQFGSPGVSASESVGPDVEVQAVGTLVAVQDRRLEPRTVVDHPGRPGHEHLLYPLEGGIEHEDPSQGSRATVEAGDLGILTEGEAGTGYTQRTRGDHAARVYAIVSAVEATGSVAGFAVIRDREMRRSSPTSGVETKLVVERDGDRVRGDLREMGDSRLEIGATASIRLDGGEGALLFCLDGRVQVTPGEEPALTGVGFDDTVIIPPTNDDRDLRVSAQAPARVLHVVTGRGAGLRFARRV